MVVLRTDVMPSKFENRGPPVETVPSQKLCDHTVRKCGKKLGSPLCMGYILSDFSYALGTLASYSASITGMGVSSYPLLGVVTLEAYLVQYSHRMHI